MNSLGERIRAARVARGLTQQALGQGVATKGFICQVERNRATPSLPKLRILADRLGLSISALTGGQPPAELTYLRKSAELAVKAGEPARALGLVDEGLALQPTANERADLFRLRGTAYDALEDLPKALAAHQMAAATAPADDPELNAAIYIEIGTVLQAQEQFSAATEASLRGLQWLDRCKHAEPALRARVLTNLGRSSYSLGQLSSARQYFEQSLDAATDAESLLRIANAHMNLGIATRATGDLDRAIEHCNRALELYRRTGHDRTANRVLNNIGDVHFAAGRTREAIDMQFRCLQRARELRDDLEVGVSAGELARYALVQGDLHAVIQFARESQSAAERANDHLHLALALAFEGQALDRQGHRRQADRCFQRAVTMLIDRQASGKLAEVGAAYADVLRARGELDRAFALMRLMADRDFSKLPAAMAAPKK